MPDVVTQLAFTSVIVTGSASITVALMSVFSWVRTHHPTRRHMVWRYITRHDDSPYLDRFIIIGAKWFGIYVHRFRSSDDVCLHDHPWPFVSIILRGGYWEETLDGRVEWYPPGRVLIRPADWTHRIIIDEAQPTWSIVFRGSKIRSWGFHTRAGWVHWRRYVSNKGRCD